MGAYPDASLPGPLLNWSQELCCSPVDKTPPCPNVLAVDSSCELSQNMLSWTNPNNSCSDDALYYIIYHKDSTSADYAVLDTVFDINTTTYLHDSLFSIAGCYAVTSVDSFGNQSLYSNIVCVDNCPYYQLPNVFTPNGDGSNDFFTPIHPYKYVQSIDIKIYNRWGAEVFRTADPEIRWNGKSMQTKMLCSDGVYYYACIVNYIRLKGIIPQVLTGYIHLLGK
jgi:gliding motility-associated-like protein